MADRIEQLAELAEQAGKRRTAEWLRTCALLPPDQWPPAPAYKGPMVPAAELEASEASARVWRGQAELWELEHQNTVLPYTNSLESERDRLSLMLRAMARKLVAYRRWADGDVPTARRLRSENEDLKGEIEDARVYVAQHSHPVNPEWTLRDLLVDFVEHLKVERDALQARIDEHEELLHAIWLYVKWRYVTKHLTTEQKNLWANAVEKISEQNHPGEGATVDRWWSAALQSDQHAELEPRCMNGPAKRDTLHMVGVIKALKSAAELDHLPLEPLRRDNFVRLARAIADHWPRDIDKPAAPFDLLETEEL